MTERPELKVVPKRRHVVRTKREKLAAILAAEVAGVVQAERQTGIPESTIRGWMEQPQFAAIRAKTREDLADEYRVAAHLSIEWLVRRIPEMEGRDLVFAMEKAGELSQLLSGHATSRVETKELLNDFDDHETEVMQEWLREQLKERLALEGMVGAPDAT